MSEIYFNWYGYTFGNCIDVYQILRPSLVDETKFLVKHYTRFDIRDIDDDINIINTVSNVMTGDFSKNGIFRIPSQDDSRKKYTYLFSLEDACHIDNSGDACSTDDMETIFKPIAVFVRAMTVG